ncbi:MAG TPA: hypothetical protein VKA31_11400 [Mariprofundaceae bacterium]|nr:hypothetical protein [Mariprofundaceae bacterium]
MAGQRIVIKRQIGQRLVSDTISISKLKTLLGTIFTSADQTKLDGIESGATADQSDAEIETAYNNQVSVVSQAEAEAGTATTVRRWTALRVAQAIAALASGGGALDTLHVQEQQADGNPAGGFTSGAWRTRTLNITVANTITGASLSSNQITLPAGTYDIEARAPGYRVDKHQCKLRNITNSVDVIAGSNSVTSSATSQQVDSFISGRFTIAGTKVLELQHQCQTTQGTNGMGIQCSYGVGEVYANVVIRKIS